MSNSIPATTDFPAPINGQPDLLIIAGEHSGDEHAAQLLTDLRRQQPELKVACLGGVELQAAGAQLLYDLTAVSIVGFVEVVRHYSFFKGLFVAIFHLILKCILRLSFIPFVENLQS